MSHHTSPAALPARVLDRADVRAALRRHDFGTVFKLARKWGGISFVKIADACDIKPERVGKLARGEGAITTYEKITRIADALRVPGHLVGLAPRPWEALSTGSAPSGKELVTAPLPTARITVAPSELEVFTAADLEGDQVQRRSFLAASAGLAGVAGTLHAEVAGRRIGRREVEQLRLRTTRLRALDDVLGGADTHRIYRAELEATERLMRQASYTKDTGRQLLAVIAEQAQQAGWTAFDMGAHQEATALYAHAHRAAKEAGDSSLEGNALAFIAYQQVSTTSSGVASATAACEAAGAEAPPTVRALLHERRAWAHAKAGEAKETEFALAEAESALADGDRPGPEWASWVDGRELQIMKGRCWTELRRPLRAVPALEKALADFDDTHARDKALYLTWLAHAYLDAEEVEHSAAVIARAMALCAGVGAVRPQQRARAFLTRLEPYRTLEPVAELLDQAAM